MLLYNVYMLQYKNAEGRIVLKNYASIILRIIGQLQSIIGINAENKGIE